MCDVIQHFERTRLDDVEAAVGEELSKLQLDRRISTGDSIALTAGSRGIANIAAILNATGDFLKNLGAQPFIVPAMGSHGGGTCEGQVGVLKSLGITEESVGVPIRATMETVVVAETAGGVPVHFDRYAYEADHVLVVGRIKPHTRFVGPIESGLHKMMLIGLGKHEGAKIYHQAILSQTFPEIIDSVGERVLQTCGIVGGLAIVENAYDETGLIEAVASDDFATREPELLQLANKWLPALPFNDVHLLIIDRIGKNISGSGMDANVVGRKYNDHAATEWDRAKCLRIFIRALTEETQGNGTGIGMSEFTTDACVAQIDHDKTRINCVTASHPEAAMIPVTLPTDAAAVSCALQTVGRVAPAEAGIIQIADTLHLSQVRVSETYFAQVESSDHLEFAGEPYDFPLDDAGRLSDVSTEIC